MGWPLGGASAVKRRSGSGVDIGMKSRYNVQSHAGESVIIIGEGCPFHKSKPMQVLADAFRVTIKLC